MRIANTSEALSFESLLEQYSREERRLPGVDDRNSRSSLAQQLVESVRRVKYVHLIRQKKHSERRLDPSSELFDPIIAASLCQRQGDIEEACWLVFISTHFGKNIDSGWRLARDFYGAFGRDEVWNWPRISAAPHMVNAFFDEHLAEISSDGVSRKFGNHRKYETLRPQSEKGTGFIVSSYVHWILQFGSHENLLSQSIQENRTPREGFNWIYKRMKVLRFGRTAKFDYLTMLGKLGLATIEPDSPYLVGATGPLLGAQLLFSGSSFSSQYSKTELDTFVIDLGDALDIGMQEMEDALCNWQKSPRKFIPFRG